MSRALIWLRRDLRLHDHPAMRLALRRGEAPIFLYLHAPEEEAPWPPGAASLVWLDRSLRSLQADLRARGSDLLIARGPSLPALLSVAQQAEVVSVYWQRRYEPAVIARDAVVKRDLRVAGLQAESVKGAVLFEPWEVQTGQGGPYKVFTPFWRNAQTRLADVVTTDAPEALPAPPAGLAASSLSVDDLGLVPRPRWDGGFWERFQPGERGAMNALEAFIDGAAEGYRSQRDLPDRAGTSRLSSHLHFGEISPQQIVTRLRSITWSAAAQNDVDGFVRELGWREFSQHLLYHFPHTTEENLNPQFSAFPWQEDAQALAAWQQGRTGVPIVDAGMRELWQTGWMHNRVRMLVASFLTKHLRQHWLHGARWFWDTLVDADLANNTQGWQWTAGTGADAAPYFRIFNPATQAERFDPKGGYVRQWLPELACLPDKALFAPWEHADLLRRLAPDYPQRPIVDLREGRELALVAYRNVSKQP
ncbi:MAG: deoxyribodipyrimidine photo-lyase [Xanthomonadales bacterium]|nr:deoxyribodipyrimidine photo-lyase [Xanthomonadales bacterium]